MSQTINPTPTNASTNTASTNTASATTAAATTASATTASATTASTTTASYSSSFSSTTSTSYSPIFAASATLSQTPDTSYDLITSSPYSTVYSYSPYPSPSAYRQNSRSPSVIIPVVNNDDTVTFSKIYFIYVGVPVGLLLLCLFAYILDIRKKIKGLKKMNALSSVQTANVARVPLNKIPPFSAV
jgi:hypothetical protein